MAESKRDSIGFAGMLAILFIGLKIAGIIHWSWWWVLSPIWIPVIIAIVCLFLWIAFNTD